MSRRGCPSTSHTELSTQELEKAAHRQGISMEELKKDEDFDPYFNLNSFSSKKTANSRLVTSASTSTSSSSKASR
jgi:hypothetical protein